VSRLPANPSEINARGLLREIGNEFQAEGWQDTSDLALRVTQQAQARSALDPRAAATLAGEEFLERNGTSVSAVECALARVFHGRTLVAGDAAGAPVAVAHQTTINIGDNNSGVTVNVGGQQQILTLASTREDVLAGVEHVLQELLDGGVDAGRISALDALVGARDDVLQDELEAVATGSIERAKPAPSKLAALRNAIVTSAASGLLVQALTAVLELH
jgi:hypothetical protein